MQASWRLVDTSSAKDQMKRWLRRSQLRPGMLVVGIDFTFSELDETPFPWLVISYVQNKNMLHFLTPDCLDRVNTEPQDGFDIIDLERWFVWRKCYTHTRTCWTWSRYTVVQRLTYGMWNYCCCCAIQKQSLCESSYFQLWWDCVLLSFWRRNTLVRSWLYNVISQS